MIIVHIKNITITVCNHNDNHCGKKRQTRSNSENGCLFCGHTIDYDHAYCVRIHNTDQKCKIIYCHGYSQLPRLRWPIKLKNNRLLIVLTSSRFLVLVAMAFIVETPRW